MAESQPTSRASQRIADELRRAILSGAITRGGVLEPTSDLLARYGVSRPTLREAFRILENEGLIVVKQGSRSGVRVLDASGESVARMAGQTLQGARATIEDLYEARLSFEPFVAAMIAKRRDRRDIAVLREAHAAMETDFETEDWPNLGAKIARFHQLLVELSGNKMLALMAQTIADVVERHQRNVSRPSKTEPEAFAADIAFRRRGTNSIAKLVRLIEAGDAEGAETHWRTHIENANETWLEDHDRHQIIDFL
jgi:GntR family transcriptional regulator, transcriptional repressor for pyruvate dehydrogenase complex